jgi:RNA polymerase sigma-70 factor (ECF subfamily)
MSATDDQELIEQFRNGQEKGFNELVARYHEKVYRVAWRFVNNHDDADDIAQEVFVKMYAALKDFRGESGVYTWLYRITVNLSLNSLRKKKVRDFLRIDEFFDIGSDENEQPDALLERSEQQELLERAVHALPEKQKMVFVLRYYEELPYEEISQILKTTVGGLKANYFHAIRKIGEFITHAHAARR